MTTYIYNNVKNICRRSALLLLIPALTACVDTIILPESLTVDEDFWKSKSDVQLMVNGAYKSMISSAVIERLIVWGGLRSDEMLSTTAQISGATSLIEDLTEINLANTQDDNTFAKWDALYAVINNCNLVLDRAEEVMTEDPSYTQGDYLSDCSQMLALRSLCYFYLVRNFRDVPYTGHAFMNSSQERNLPQASPDSVLTLCINDLKTAERNALSPTAFDDWRRVGYFTRDGIQALLADIYLWRASVTHDKADYAACDEYCAKVIESKKAQHVVRPGVVENKQYPLADGNNMFTSLFVRQNAEESILEMQLDGVTNSNTSFCQYFNRYSDSEARHFIYAPTIFEKGGTVYTSSSATDWRGTENTYPDKINIGENDALEIRKFVAQDGGMLLSPSSSVGSKNRGTSQYSQNYVFYRLADVMLMKAEALAGLATDDNDREHLEAAFTLVNAVNKRAKPDESITSGDTLKWNTYSGGISSIENLVLAERLRELAFEGKRWYDLMRYSYRHMEGVDYTKTLYDQSLGDRWAAPKTHQPMLDLMKRKLSGNGNAVAAKISDETKLYMPIPLTDLTICPVLHQNPGYATSDILVKN